MHALNASSSPPALLSLPFFSLRSLRSYVSVQDQRRAFFNPFVRSQSVKPASFSALSSLPLFFPARRVRVRSHPLARSLARSSVYALGEESPLGRTIGLNRGTRATRRDATRRVLRNLSRGRETRRAKLEPEAESFVARFFLISRDALSRGTSSRVCHRHLSRIGRFLVE